MYLIINKIAVYNTLYSLFGCKVGGKLTGKCKPNMLYNQRYKQGKNAP